jgi:hypothetical protein
MNFREYLSSLTPEEIQSKNEEIIKENEEIYKDFKNAYHKKCCSLCGNRLEYFDKTEKCFHWFVLPKGIRKKDFDNYLIEPVGYFKLESYFRWISTLENPLVNINDLSDEISESKIKEITIKYKNIEWSLTFGKSDLAGHLESKNANFPHFHLQMLVDNKPYIVFNNYHIPFSDEDLFNIKLMIEDKDLVNFRNDFGEGMSLIENSENLLELDKNLKVAQNEETAPFNTTSIIQMPEGKTMSGEILQKILLESKETKTLIRHLIPKYYPDAKITSEIFAGKGVPKMKKRTKRK